ncbi:anti-repressor SinI family protein [Pseudomonas sp. ISL-88]|uniref:anti-repressor SinI family protein n=1 Tax=Bacteria TaxID=2 RepID=UPI001BEAE222|nr:MULTISPECIES: anti-repressor SinI family protein [Bacteria]MBT2634058.1 anti-repressor SinI family protein [Bacillus sp. ISL-26]MBT2713618.1 anti-repressor SinI family protein [Pseudomonas sp. ISL-88]MBY8911842.1 anti-repressor SinI family protein [Bacillus sp. YC2]
MKTHAMKDVDQDWHLLIQEARIMGLHIDDVRRFLNAEKAVKKKTPMKNTIRQP